MNPNTQRKPVDTLTDRELRAVLRASEARARDHLLLSLAAGTGLRVSELVALNVGDVLTPENHVRTPFALRAETTKRKRGGMVALNPRLVAKVLAFIAWKVTEGGESLDADAPLFVSRESGRMSIRLAQHVFYHWQEVAKLPRRHKFHALRHTFCTNLWRATGDLRLVQTAARHASIVTTTVYTHPNLEDLARGVATLEC